MGHRGPHESGEFAGGRNVCDSRALSRATRQDLGERSVAVMQADLGLPGARADVRGDTVGEPVGALAAAWSVAVMPGRFDEQPAGVLVAALADVAAVLLLSLIHI